MTTLRMAGNMKSTRRTILAVLVVSVAALFGCEYPADMWIVPGSTVSRLVFGVAANRDRDDGLPVNGLAVSTRPDLCNGRTRQAPKRRVMWAMEAVEHKGEPPSLTRVVYGTTPSGYITKIGPERLAPGCYETSVSANRGRSGGTFFEVTLDGTLQERFKSE